MVKGKKRQEGGCSRQRDEGVQEQRALRRAGGRPQTPLRAEHPLRSRLADQASCVSGVTPREAGAARGSHLVIPPRSAECPRQAAAAPPLPSGSRAARLPPLRLESFPARPWRRWAAGGGGGGGDPARLAPPLSAGSEAGTCRAHSTYHRKVVMTRLKIKQSGHGGAGWEGGRYLKTLPA